MGVTVIEPSSETAVPFKVACTALLVPQVRTEDWPLVIEVALALILAATVPNRHAPISVAPACGRDTPI